MLQQLSVIVLPALVALTAARELTPSNRIWVDPLVAVHAPTQAHEANTWALQAPQARTTRWVVAPTGNEARYRVREQLAGMDLPNDAVGKTSQVTGALILGSDGKIVRDGSSFTVDLASIKSDQDRRDNYVRRNTLKTDSFPTAVFVPTAFQGLPTTLPTSGEMTFQLTGDLTVGGVTKPATWQVKATRAASGAISGTATTNFKFAEYNIATPRVARVLSVDDNITLEYDFTLVPEAPKG
jgi:polyisoprenoid-binding protein YceI